MVQTLNLHVNHYTLQVTKLYKIYRTINSFMTEVPINRNQSIDLLCKSMDWFLYDIDLRHERFKSIRLIKLQNRANQQQRLLFDFSRKTSQEQQVIYYMLPLQIVSKNNYELVDNYLHLQLQF